MPLRTHHELPGGLLSCEAAALDAHLGGPTLIHLKGRRGPALFVSVLLHGNETSGWDGVRRLLSGTARLDRDLTLFVGNTRAAALNLRALPGQPDFNRIWRDATGPGAALAAAVRAAIADVPLFAAVDLHNNTGHNPYYAVVTDLSPRNLGLAHLFSDKAVHVEEPDTVLTRVFDGWCPAVTLEVGPVSDPRCADRVVGYLERCLTLDEVPLARREELRLYRARVRVHVVDDVAFGFEGGYVQGAPLVLTGGVEAVNFHALPAGTVFGTSILPLDRVLRVLDPAHRDVTDGYLRREGDRIVLRQSVVPAMYTTDPFVVRQDCLCYFMERIPT